MIDHTFAASFAQDWIEAWNTHDLPRVLAHYTHDCELFSPMIIQVAGEASGRLQGKAAIAAYWSDCLALMPDLQFELITTLVGIDTITLYYQGVRGLVAEVLWFNAEGQAIKACACYA